MLNIHIGTLSRPVSGNTLRILRATKNLPPLLAASYSFARPLGTHSLYMSPDTASHCSPWGAQIGVSMNHEHWPDSAEELLLHHSFSVIR